MTDVQFMGLIGLGAAAIAAIPPSIIAWSARTKAETLIEKTAEIHTLTNSTLSTTTSALAVANTEIKGLVKAQEIADKKNEELQSLVLSLLEQEKHTENAVKETNGILTRKADSGPLPVVDDQLATKIDGIVTTKLDKIQDTVDEKK